VDKSKEKEIKGLGKEERKGLLSFYGESDRVGFYI